MRSNINPYFNRNTTFAIKGIAIIMMFVHHFFTFPSWWVKGVSYPAGQAWEYYLRDPLRLCVSIFCFLTGYFYFFTKHKNYKYSFKKILSVLMPFWFVYLLYSVIAVYATGYQYSLKEYLLEMFALYRPTMYFCWYINYYIICMLLLPLCVRLMSKNIHSDLLLALVIYMLPIGGIHLLSKEWNYGITENLLLFFPVTLVGYVFANYDLFKKVEVINNNLVKPKAINIFICFSLLVLAPLCRNTEFGITIIFSKSIYYHMCMDAVYSPIFIYACVRLFNIIKFATLEKSLFFLGQKSMLMWFVSCIFFGNSKQFVQPLLYYPHHPVLVTVWGLLMCYVSAVILDAVIEKIRTWGNIVYNKAL